MELWFAGFETLLRMCAAQEKVWAAMMEAGQDILDPPAAHQREVSRAIQRTVVLIVVQTENT
jgi:hypothetical protein